MLTSSHSPSRTMDQFRVPPPPRISSSTPKTSPIRSTAISMSSVSSPAMRLEAPTERRCALKASLALFGISSTMWASTSK